MASKPVKTTEADRPITLHAARKHPICGAKTHSGGICKQPALPNGRCHYHGGKSLKGFASGTFKDGRYSRYMPGRMLEKYQQSLDDPELLNMRAEVSLIDARLSDLLKRADSGEAGTLWEKARKANLEIQKAVHDENYGRMLVMCLELDRLIGDGLADHEIWYEIQSLIDQRRKVVEAEQKRLVAMQQMITAEQAMAFVAALAESVKRHVSDRKQLASIQDDLTRIINAGVQQSASVAVE